ncbi:metallophosphoesterase [Halomicroarcula sp. S1AR25-4]|uniref:metallophosphoesterase n=1 Tax=Haloarcula sp. S1AR25-4 TaxID=2950538 RepID=UPI0028769DFF|nr:metallophosphoesterase [Halomicroarcula sp. S1AR25-4]MDS0277095.1 metallophosphoesterase [Halomicroarcula sp. S1AR25-4]
MDGRYDDRALVVDDTLVVADLHVGRGTGGNLEFPVGSGTDVGERFRSLVERHDPETAVVAGDLLHSFRTVPRTVEDTVAGLKAACRDGGARLVVTPGNHDTMLDSVWDGPVEREYRIGDTVVLHGHEAPESDADRYVVGHDHPTIVIEGQRRPCYLVGTGQYEGSDVVMLPSFNRLNAGVVVNELSAADFQSPLLTDVDRLEPIVWDESARQTRSFPPLGEFRRML